MALDADQRLKLEMIIEGTKEQPDELSNWETGFVSSIAMRYEEYKDSILLSEKQWVILDRIYDAIMLKAAA